ncbi:MAG: group 1 truncated hemoglobin [Saprospiraceae bacterium]|nr:group 1 truncated hemoglobin [Saprospiraceae bacterium]
MKKILIVLALVLVGQLILTSCKDDEPVKSSLYVRLGGGSAIAAVVDKFIGYVATDPKMVRTFAPLLEDVGKGNTARVTALRNNLIDQIGEASGGPEKYKGKDMVTAHKGMNITDDEFNALVGDLVKALNDFNVPSAEQSELLGVLGGLKSQIVGK